MSIKSPGLGAGGLASLANYASGTFTVTLTGIDAVVTGTASYVILGNMVMLFIPSITGTSNSAAKGLSGIPAAIRPAAIQQSFISVTDSAITSNVGRVRINTDGTATLAIVTPSTNAITTTFTATGSFVLGFFTICYPLA